MGAALFMVIRDYTSVVTVGYGFGSGVGWLLAIPAMAGRCFVYICFPVAMTTVWAPAAQGPWGALNLWTGSLPDAITAATPMALAFIGFTGVLQGR
jgi:Na+-translocating ferredoxin:NAD+ oxidoreductase RnfD subunit